MEYLPPSNRVQEGDLDASPITAEGKHVVIIGGGDTGADCLGTATARARRRSTSSRSCRGRPISADSTPWPTWPMIFRTSSAHEEGGERVFAVNTECFLGDDAGNVRALRAHEVERFVDGRMTFEKIDGTDFELAVRARVARDGLPRTGAPGLLEQLGVEIDGAGNVARDDDGRRTSRASSSAATWAAARA